MTRYTPATGIEAEYEPGSRGRVARNLLGIKRKADMDAAENEALSAAQKRYFRTTDMNARITISLIRKMHRDWLGDIYKWAGSYRTVELSKDGFVWPPAYLVPQNMERFEKEVLAQHTPCRAEDLKKACTSIAAVHAELLLIHPFRDGNGRIARWLADLMAGQAGFLPPLYKFEGRGSRAVRMRYVAAVTAGYTGRYADLEAFFEDALRLRLGA